VFIATFHAYFASSNVCIEAFNAYFETLHAYFASKQAFIATFHACFASKEARRSGKSFALTPGLTQDDYLTMRWLSVLVVKETNCSVTELFCPSHTTLLQSDNSPTSNYIP
jgi:hypothetical protein